MKKLVVSGSQLEKFNWCQAEHFARNVARRRRQGEWSHPAAVGTAAHEVWAERLKGGWAPSHASVPERYIKACGERPIAVDPKHLREAGYVDHWIAAWWGENEGRYPWAKVHAVEQAFEIEVGEFTDEHGEKVVVAIEGIFDAVSEGSEAGTGRLWHDQLKTRSPRGEWHDFVGEVGFSYHELFYAHAVKEQMVGAVPYGGTHLTTVDKVSPVDKNGNARTTAEAVKMAYLPMTEPAIEKALLDLMEAAPVIQAQREMLEKWDANVLPFMPARTTGRGHGCRGKYGSSRCSMWEVCRDVLPLSDNFQFESFDPRERYNSATAEGE